VPLELARMDATHLTSMACKVSATDCSDAGSGKRRGRQVKPLGANGCLVMGSLGFFFFFFFSGWESYSLHIHGHATKETTSVKRKAIHSRSCKLPSLLG